MDLLEEASETLEEALESLTEKKKKGKPFCKPVSKDKCKIEKLGLTGKWRNIAHHNAFFADTVDGPMFLPGMKFKMKDVKKGEGPVDPRHKRSKLFKMLGFKDIGDVEDSDDETGGRSKKKKKSIFAKIRTVLSKLRGKSR